MKKIIKKIAKTAIKIEKYYTFIFVDETVTTYVVKLFGFRIYKAVFSIKN